MTKKFCAEAYEFQPWYKKFLCSMITWHSLLVFLLVGGILAVAYFTELKFTNYAGPLVKNTEPEQNKFT